MAVSHARCLAMPVTIKIAEVEFDPTVSSEAGMARAVPGWPTSKPERLDLIFSPIAKNSAGFDPASSSSAGT